jgi:hypothetical protein
MLSQPFRKRTQPVGRTRPRGPRHTEQVSASRLRLWLEALEDRSLPSVFMVTTVADDGLGSFRRAILDSNSNPGTDTIAFNIGGGGVQTIQPLSALPEVMDPVVIDGRTQPGFAGTPMIVLDGSGTGFFANGLTITAGNSTVQGLVVHSFGRTAIVLSGGGGNVVVGNYIGTDATGTRREGDGNNIGLSISSADNRVGGTAEGERNLISGNREAGILDSGSGNVVLGNFIGTDVTGTQFIGNGVGVAVGGSDNTVGGPMPGARNLISANVVGVSIVSRGSVVLGNYIGTDVTGAVRLGNFTGVSLLSEPSFGVFSTDNTIGGTTPEARNLISGNIFNGIVLNESGTTGNRIEGNYIGTDATGTQALDNGIGVNFNRAANNTLGGTADGAGNLISGNTIGVYFVNQATGNQVQGNLIGTDASGTQALGNDTGVSFDLSTASPNNTIGGAVAGARNVISGNTGVGVDLASQNNRIEGNYIGADTTGTRAVPNGTGVIVRGTDHAIGGTAPGAGNLISGNRGSGVVINAGTANRVQGNLIGTDATGRTALGNQQSGVEVGPAASNITIGGTEAGAGNTIAFNGGVGVLVQGAGATGNSIRGNAIHSNGGLGIDLGGDGVTPNDPGDADTGPNQLQNLPVLSVALAGGTTRVTGTLNSSATTIFTLDFYASTVADPSGFGEGARYLGSAVVTTDSSGNARFDVTLAAATASSEVVTATATDPDGNTSEFSPTVLAGQQVAIDIKPDDPDNAINLGSNGLLPVAVLTTPDFDARTVDTSDLSRIRFGDVNGSLRVSPTRSALEDVDANGDVDLVLFFSMPTIRNMGALTAASTHAELTAFTTDGIPVSGTDTVQIVPDNPVASVLRSPSFVESFLSVLRTEPTLFRQLVRRLHLTIADVTGDGTLDVILLGGQKRLPILMVIDGVAGQMARVFPFAVTLHSEPFLMIADVNGDGVSDVIVDAIALHGPRLWAFDVLTGRLIAQI